jgi:eukaryotic-like serine/threonine-protein kinase
MSFILRKKQSSGARRVAGEAPLAFLPPDLVEAGARRLAVLGLLCASVTVIMSAVDWHTFARMPLPPRALTVWIVAGIAGAILSVAISWVAFRQMLSPEALLDLGLVYEVALALFIAMGFHAVPLRPDVVPRGWSAVAVWILAYPLIVPGTRGKTLLATFAAAAMDPLGLGINVLAGNPMPSASASVILFLPTFVCAAIAVIVSRIVYALTVEAGKGQEMGSYNLEELLGRGGMGEVWRGSHRLLARSAAIKLIRPDTLGSDAREWLKRFEREAKATAGLRSPHTVGIYDYGTTEDGTFYYVMELLEGFDLESLVNEFGPVPPERAIHILVQACHSLAEAHQGGLIHRDIKPANVYVCRYGLDWDFVKLLDFGLVKSTGVADERGRQLTVAGVIAGTPAYMAPEIGMGSPDVDWRADIYALGCVGYWLLTGQQVFEGSTPMQVVLAHVQKAPVPPSLRTTQEIPPALEEILMACLRKDPNDRPQTMQELAQSLAAVKLANPWTQERARRWWLEHAADASRRKHSDAVAAPGSTPSAEAALGPGLSPAQDRQSARSPAGV